MATLYTHADSNRRKTYFFITIFLVIVIAVGWAASYIWDSYGILVLAVLVSIGMSFASYWWSDKIVLAISRAHKLNPSANLASKEIYRLVENLCITAGLPNPKIYIIDDEALNAFATGRDPEHAVIALTRGIIEKLERSELEGVIAHELAHVGNRDTLIQTVVVVLVGVVTLLADWTLRFSFFGRRRDDNGGGQLGAILGIVGIILLILSPIVAELIKLAVSRKREFLADASGALLTRYPEGLARALEKISQDNSKLEVANKATAHLYIANPLRGRRGIANKLFSTHPPIEERIAALRGMEIQ